MSIGIKSAPSVRRALGGLLLRVASSSPVRTIRKTALLGFRPRRDSGRLNHNSRSQD